MTYDRGKQTEEGREGGAGSDRGQNRALKVSHTNTMRDRRYEKDDSRWWREEGGWRFMQAKTAMPRETAQDVSFS